MKKILRILFLLLISVIVGCAALQKIELDQQYGPAYPRSRLVERVSGRIDYLRDVKPILDNRCTVCHGCYDAPCQLKLSAIEGIERGASKAKVYDGSRLLAANLTRLFDDANSMEQWRQKGFYPVLNERDQTEAANLSGGTMARMLELKRLHPLPNGDRLPESFDFSLNRDQQCPKVEEFESFAKDYPLWGMPYGFPGLTDSEHNILVEWLKQGARHQNHAPISKDYSMRIAEWETFLNGRSLKRQLMARYIYEHLFLAHLYFDGYEIPLFFRLVRSKSKPGNPIELIATRRPYDDPKTDKVYYRLQPVRTTILVKTHLPYALSPTRMARYRELFLTPQYEVSRLPSYDVATAANPFIAFRSIPVSARYRFMLDEAQFTIMGFIKGPVCRGQMALNVIEDQFWLVFVDPDHPLIDPQNEFLAKEKTNLRLPAQNQSNSTALLAWLEYSKRQKNYLKAKARYLEKNLTDKKDISLDLIWDGDGHNPNAALTIFRHFDSASVVQGFVGDSPKTAWVIGYPLLERIHYLLVAGFDVYGNYGHQLNSRLYMDFLRMEGEFNFLTLLPRKDRQTERNYWYRGASEQVKSYIYGQRINFDQDSGINFRTDNPKAELFELLRQRLRSVLNGSYAIDQIKDPMVEKSLARLARLQGAGLSPIPQTVFLTITNIETGSLGMYTLIHNIGHSNVSHLFSESAEYLPNEDSLTVTKGFVGAYPNAFLHVKKSQLIELVDAISGIKHNEDYRSLLDRFGVRRTNPGFWRYSDRLHSAYKNENFFEAGIFDYNRLENR